MPSAKAAAWLRLAMTRGIGSMLGRKLVRAVGSIELLWQQTAADLKAIEGIGTKLLSALGQSRADAADAVLATCRDLNIGLVCPDDPDWPQALVHIDDAPLVLFYRGDVASLNALRLLAMVGARRSSRESSVITRRWSHYLSDRQVCVVSGMAYGIDAAAHGGALEGDSTTLAVLGCGLASLTEQQQRQVQAIAAQGCVISEFLPSATARPEFFPRRNRIIAGISHATLVMEADVRSGSLITARQAIEYGREVFAVPGSVLGGKHAGCHLLIREGAILAETADDVLQSLGWLSTTGDSKSALPLYSPADTDEAALLQALSAESMHLDHLAESCGLTVPELSPIVLRLELQGMIERLPGSRYLLACDISDVNTK